MKSLILFYSFTGNTRELALKKAEELGADIEEIQEINKPCIFRAYTIGVYRAIKRKIALIQPLKSDLADYEKIIIMSPIWGFFPVSPINSVIECLPAGKKIEIIMVSGGGGSKKTANGTKELVQKQGCEVIDYVDIFAKRTKDKLVWHVLKQ
ncbi:MAG: hypothetical protein FWG98_08780 [Candidatus Cloacimonetes bacterium]|nr:hypothetical protein [Candidatus Cloacimonadota bacterium]